MIMVIGIVTMSTLVWLLVSCLAGESDAKRRRTGLSPRTGFLAKFLSQPWQPETSCLVSSQVSVLYGV